MIEEQKSSRDSEKQEMFKQVVLSSGTNCDGLIRCLNSFQSYLKESPPGGVNDCNYVQGCAVKFKVAPTAQITFFDVFTFKKHFGQLFSAFYFIRSATEKHTYLLCARLYNYSSRRRFLTCLILMVRIMTKNMVISTHKFSLRGRMQSKQQECGAVIMRRIADYKKENMIMMMSTGNGTILETEGYMINVNVTELVEQIKKDYIHLMSEICLAPHGYNTVLRDLQSMSVAELRKYLKERDLETIFNDIKYHTLDVVITNATKKGTLNLTKRASDIRQILSDECVKQSIFNSTHEKIYTQFVQCILGVDNYNFGHPTLFYSLKRNMTKLFRTKPADVCLYHPEFIVSILLIGRYFARVFMQKQETISSNRATLLMCGAAGAGKTLITDSLAQYFEGYKWNTDSIYQSLKLLSSSTIIIEEVRLEYLNTPVGKQLTDYTAAAKVEIKNAHPVDATRHCPVIMNTNENIFSYVNERTRATARYSEEQLQAIQRRLCIVPFTSKFTNLHQLDTHARQIKYSVEYKEFCDMESAKTQLFNFFFVFGLHQDNLTSFETFKSMQEYVYELVIDFNKTVFGRVYLTYKQEIDSMLSLLEETIHRCYSDERAAEKMIMRVANDINAFIEATFIELIDQCVNVNDLRGIWKRQNWSDSSEFMRKVLITKDDVFQRKLASFPSQFETVTPQWRKVFEEGELELNSGSDVDLSDVEYDCTENIEIYFTGPKEPADSTAQQAS